MRQYTVENRFHGTTAKTTLTPDEYALVGYPEDSDEQVSIDRRAKRLKEALCGCPDCKCSGMDRYVNA